MKISEFTELTTVAGSDLLVIVDDPGGTPVTKKITVTNLIAASVLPSHNHAASDITSGTLAHERGGLEFNASAITTGGLIRGASAGVMSILTVGTDGQVLTAQADGSVAWEDAVGSAVDALELKASVKAATTANITLSGEQTIDGVSCVTGNRVLVKDQSTASQNGIYVVDAYSWTRASDMAAASNAAANFCFVQQGTVNADTGWLCTNNDGGAVVGTNNLVFAIFANATTSQWFLHSTGELLYASLGGTTKFRIGEGSSGPTDQCFTIVIGIFSTSASSMTFNWIEGNLIQITMTASIATLTMNGPFLSTSFTAELPASLYLKVIQGGTGSYTINWPSNVKWAGGSAPTLSTTVGDVDLIHFLFDGTDFYGQVMGLDYQ